MNIENILVKKLGRFGVKIGDGLIFLIPDPLKTSSSL